MLPQNSREHPDKKEIIEDEFGHVVQETTLVWNFQQNAYSVHKKKTWQRDDSGHYAPLRSEYYGTNGLLQVVNQYEVTSEGLSGTHTVLSYTNGHIIRQFAEKKKYHNNQWELISTTDTSFQYTKSGDISRAEAIITNPTGKLLETQIGDYTYSAPGKLYESNISIYDDQDLLKEQSHYMHQPRTVCTSQKNYVPILGQKDRVMLAFSAHCDPTTMETHTILYHAESTDFSKFSATEIKDGHVVRHYPCDAEGNALTKQSVRTSTIPYAKLHREEY